MKKINPTAKWILISIVAIVLILGVIYLFNFQKEKTSTNSNISNNSTTQIANPASTNCIELGGELEIREDEEGNQFGVCIKEGNECEEWKLFNGECEL